ncbi:5-deoxy-glucuronate isomerase [Alkalihalophilus lindianensis]|uniref:5-deoxy-glucuronate isomerase n=1 Tax=Alkalihalophilus lindianensis TaxID=1630542 RepID=A0ABU3X4S2_9BACI|nr:5-deoxy-glucuronate isomerase [Alkalihalophilus lindianensis]MDV2682890.1 5-deoxy-glucuronate isomerase [Alkalihalophilus lindianensis]
MSKLLVKPQAPNQQGKILDVTPESAGWKYVGFEVYTLKSGESIENQTEDKEICLVLLTGKATVKTRNEVFEKVGKRLNVFEKIPPYSIYIPNNDFYHLEALTEVKVAVCSAPGKGNYSARLIGPEDVGMEDRGSGKMSRKVHNILPETEEADSLLVVEVFTPDGNTSSYPPHKHDQDNLPEESYLEETYYHELNPSQGFAFQRIYNDDRSLDETMAVEHQNVVLVPEGYHPVSCVPGYESYYLNVMAGPIRTWKFNNEIAHEWLFVTK